MKITLPNEKYVLSYSLQLKQTECWSIQIRLIFAELQFIDAQKQNEIYVYITDCQYSLKNNTKIILEIDKGKKERKLVRDRL